MAADQTRRALLASAGLPLLLSACKGVQVLGSPPPPPLDVRALRAAIAAEDHLVRTYAAASQPATVGQSPAVQIAVLTAVLAEHRQHLAQLKTRLKESAAQASAAATRVHHHGAGSAIPDIAQLEQAEAAASDRLIGQLAGLPPSLAQLFASIAASEATHVPLLRSAGRHG